MDALSRGAADLVEMFPGPARIVSVQHLYLEISTNVLDFLLYLFSK